MSICVLGVFGTVLYSKVNGYLFTFSKNRIFNAGLLLAILAMNKPGKIKAYSVTELHLLLLLLLLLYTEEFTTLK